MEEVNPYITSATGIMNYLITPAHYKCFNIDRLRKPSPLMKEGTALHYAVLEPHKFDEMVVTEDFIPEGMTVLSLVSDMKEFLTRHNIDSKGLKKPDLIERCKGLIEAGPVPGYLMDEDVKRINLEKIRLTPDKKETILRIRDRVHENPFFKTHKDKGKFEYFLRGEIEGVEVRGRIDWFFFLDDMDKYVIVDLKKVPCAEAHPFQRSIYAMNYYIQAWIYCELLRQETGKECVYAWMLAEGALPHICEVYACDFGTLDAAESMARQALRNMKKSIDTDSWPGYTDGKLKNIAMPPWAFDVVSDILEKQEGVEDVH